MHELKIAATNAAMIAGTLVSWISSIDTILRLFVTILTVIIGLLSLEKLLSERRKRKKLPDDHNYNHAPRPSEKRNHKIEI